MPKRLFYALCAGLLLLTGSASAADRPPNLLFILADDLGYGDPAFMGGRDAQTPHLDALAASGLTFTHAYANAAVCAPTRAAIFSGQYAVRTGVYKVGGGRGRGGQTTPASQKLVTPQNVDHLAPDLVTLAEALSDAGYATGHVGKWHLGTPGSANGPVANGFDLSVGAARGGGTRTYYAPWNLPNLGEAADGTYLTDRLTEHAEGFIRDHADRPFFLYASHYAVHTPIEADPAVLKRVKARSPELSENAAEYAAVLESFDQGVGRLLAALDEAGVADNTVVVFASDNGGHRRYGDMGPLRGNKGTLDEGGIRVPCTVRWTGTIAPGRTSDTPVALMDLYPTFLELAGAREPADQPIDGQSWVSLLKQPDTPAKALTDRPLFWYLPVYATGPSGRVTAPPQAVIRRGPWKLVVNLENQDEKLFHLIDDPGEDRNRADSEPDVIDALKSDLVSWQLATKAPVPMRNPNYDPNAAAETSDRGRGRRNRGERGERGQRGQRGDRQNRNR